MKYKFTQETFLEECIKIHNNKYNYENVKFTKLNDKIIIICPIHGEFVQLAHNHISGKGCKRCSGNVKPSKEEYTHRCNIIHNNKYDYSLIKEIDYKVPIICPSHGLFYQNYNNHLSGKGCPQCALILSKGELEIKTLLEINNINFIQQKTFNDCKYKRKLPFDFYIPDKNIFIEYQGKQHITKNSYYNNNNEEVFNRRKYIDQLKRNYALNNGHYIEIFCYDNIKNKLLDELQKYGIHIII